MGFTEVMLASEMVPTPFDDSAAKFVQSDFAAIQQASFGDDSKVVARFYYRKPEDNFDPNEKGEIFCKIIIPGNSGMVHDQPVRDIDKQRFAKQWFDFMNNREQVSSGIPLANWGYLAQHPHQIDYLKSKHIHTVEQLAGVSDAMLREIGQGALTLRREAQKFVDSSKSTEAMEKAAEVAVKAQGNSEIEELKAQMAALMQTLNKGGEVAVKKKRGPKAKTETGETANGAE
jgi:hypothetical protein